MWIALVALRVFFFTFSFYLWLPRRRNHLNLFRVKRIFFKNHYIFLLKINPLLGIPGTFFFQKPFFWKYCTSSISQEALGKKIDRSQTVERKVYFLTSQHFSALMLNFEFVSSYSFFSVGSKPISRFTHSKSTTPKILP